MYIIEIETAPQSWVAAVYKNKEDGEAYLESFPEKLRWQATIKKIDIDFPLFIIETIENKQNQFEYLDHEGLVNRIRNQKKSTTEDDDHVYFNFYELNEDYFQEDVEKDQMGALQHTHVDNSYLNEEEISRSQYFDSIRELEYNYDIDRLDELYKQFMENNAAEYEKEELATHGYMNLFWQMNYDFACGKLTDGACDYLLHLVEQAERLTGKRYWEPTAEAHLIILENACNKNDENIKVYLDNAIKALNLYWKELPQSTQEVYQKLALAYNFVAQAYPEKGEAYLTEAIDLLKRSIEIAPEKGDWAFYLRLLYLPVLLTEKIMYSIEEGKTIDSVSEMTGDITNRYVNKKISPSQLQAQRILNEFMQKQESVSAKMPYLYALAFYNLSRHLEWFKLSQSLFPESPYIYWLEKSLLWYPETINRIDLSEACQMWGIEGVRLKRVDLLEKAIAMYERVLDKIDDNAFEIYYIAKLWQQISEIYHEKKQYDLADTAMSNALKTYQDNLDTIKNKPSTYLHYAEFLYELHKYEGNVAKPTTETLKQILIEVEEEAQGHYSRPVLMRMHTALIESDEHEAIYHLTKSLILHELCIENEIVQLKEQYENSPWQSLKLFLEETLSFMNEVHENYYLDTEVKWDTLKVMSREEVQVYWQQRKEQIRSRPVPDWKNHET